ncbi:nucleoside-diphosphate sugar epimerase/dehydratase [Halocynthiibacter sp. C4]|uniref:polysaccharide biosynthesis protein n=1 Tax=Halocynthiibacter sp. C4 TaxID=2992758 RepID=UPI00237AF2E8|nr:nucleoside-diphosphate sugar epimerase/dehydratase [Halocynthiibacter sp. C4]MDE0589468.1 nucleoside-diphosphate sugar epimerase/dehydratase [Halocynthiibacter sp. C4]
MHNFIDTVPRSVKRLIYLSVDAVLLPVALFAAFALRYGEFTPWEQVSESWILFPTVLCFGMAANILLGFSRVKLSTFGVRDIGKAALIAITMTVVSICTCYILDLATPRSVPLIFGILLFLGTMGSRLTGRALLQVLYDHGHERRPVAIYGAGSAGNQLASALGRSKIKPIVFVDDNPSLHGVIMGGLPVCDPEKLKSLIEKGKIESVILATPSATEEQKRRISLKLADLGAEVLSLPSYNEIIAGRGLVESLRQVSPDELLGRDKVDLNLPGVSDVYADKSVFVSGAGGSIGSELCRQVLKHNPRKIVLFEHSEFALYSIDQELRPLAEAAGVEIVATLGSVCDKRRVVRTMQIHQTDIVLHAAAYKHVPLVESNELEGLRNNVLGTRVLANAARELEIERFILISTDKAVRPTNVMGASKRLAELIVQDIDSRSPKTLFSMVRFGNVLGSSGSVIPLFREQIARGGPVTVTHAEVTRYFMTIPEAARLVLIAGTFARGGDVFVLDMGKAVAILDLAKRMIRLSGKTLKCPQTPDGDIEIVVTGLRPGEKLYEELLIGENILNTPHPKIMRAQEGCLSELEVQSAIRDLNQAIESGETARCRSILNHWIEDYHQPQEAKQSG